MSGPNASARVRRAEHFALHTCTARDQQQKTGLECRCSRNTNSHSDIYIMILDQGNN